MAPFPTDLWHCTIAQAAALLAAREISPVDLVEACLARIEAVDGRIHSYIHVAAEPSPCSGAGRRAGTPRRVAAQSAAWHSVWR